MVLLLDLPAEVLNVILNQIERLRDLAAIAGACHALESYTDEIARQLCKNKRGLWSRGFSWRVQLAGRTYKAGMRVREQYGSAGTRRSGQRLFTKPTAISAHAAQNIVAVCDAGSLEVVLFRLDTGAVLQRFEINGVPTGALFIPGLADGAGHPEAAPALAVVVQGENEDGSPHPRVTDRRHRIQLYRMHEHPPPGIPEGEWVERVGRASDGPVGDGC